MKKNTLFTVVHFLMYLFTCYSLTVAHGIYEKYPNFITSLLFPINESVWEHGKLFFLPCIISFLIIFIIVGRKYPNFLTGATLSCALMVIAMVVLCPTLSKLLGITEETELVYSITMTCIILLIGFTFTYFISLSSKDFKKYRTAGFITLGAMYIIFAICTFYPPKLSLWLDTCNNEYGFITPK